MERKVLLLVKKAAVTGGDVLMRHFQNGYHITKKGQNDVVTNVDIEAERMIIRIIENVFPKHNILSEEKGLINKKSEYTWVIDPLDGTQNYIRKIPVFGNSIALERNGQAVLGIVYLPMTNELIYAFKGEGAFINDVPLPKLTHTRKKVEELFITFCHGHKKEDITKIIDYFNKIRPQVTDFRKLGASTIEITHVARGLVDGYIATGIPVWDFKAASLIVSEVGGTVNLTKDNTAFVFAPGVEQILSHALKTH